MDITRRKIFQLGSLGTMVGLSSLTTGCDIGSMFAVPPRETRYFTPNEKFYTVNYMDSPYNLSRDLDQEQWQMVVKGAVSNPMVLKWRDLLNRQPFDQVSTLMCIDTLPGGTSLGNAIWRGISLKELLIEAGADAETARDVIFREPTPIMTAFPLNGPCTMK